MLGRESLVVLVNLSQLMAGKTDEPILHVWGWVNYRMAIVVGISYSQMICGYRFPDTLKDRDLDWDPESGLRLIN